MVSAISAVRKEEVVFKTDAKLHNGTRSTLQRYVNDISEEVVFKTDAKLHNGTRSTLQRYVNDISVNPEEAVATALGRKSVLSKETEDSLFNYCIDTDARYFGLLAADVRCLDYQLAIRDGLPHPFSYKKLRPETND
jgi:hypothetical protein